MNTRYQSSESKTRNEHTMAEDKYNKMEKNNDEENMEAKPKCSRSFMGKKIQTDAYKTQIPKARALHIFQDKTKHQK